MKLTITIAGLPENLTQEQSHSLNEAFFDFQKRIAGSITQCFSMNAVREPETTEET
jgi:hypothetical protein